MSWCLTFVVDFAKCQAIKGHNQSLMSKPTDRLLLVHTFTMILSVFWDIYVLKKYMKSLIID